MKTYVFVSEVIKSIFTRVIIGLTLSFLLSQNSYACPTSSPPIDVNNIIDLSKTEGLFLTAVADCDECENDRFNEVSLKIVGSDQTFKVDAWLVDRTINNHGAFMKNFDLWHSWGGEPAGCGMVPVVQKGLVYDIFVTGGKVLWLDKHDPFMMSFFSIEASSNTTSDDYFEYLAWEIFRNASEYWVCENEKPYELKAADSSFDKTSRNISRSSLHNLPRCNGKTQTLGSVSYTHLTLPTTPYV